MRDMAEMTATEVDALPRETTCIFLTFSPIEEHGPHLPLATDIIEADGMTEKLCARFEDDFPDWHFLKYPSIPIGVDALPYPGSVSVRPRVLREMLFDIGKCLGREGFRNIIISSHHGSPRHILALDEACQKLEDKAIARALSLSGYVVVDLFIKGGMKAFFGTMDYDRGMIEQLKHDVHGGAFETSEVLHLRPDLVRPIFEKLKEVALPVWKMRPSSAREYQGGQGYFGSPALASAEMGEAYMDFIIDRIYPEACAFLGGERIATLPRHWALVMRTLERVNRSRDVVSQWLKP